MPGQQPSSQRSSQFGVLRDASGYRTHHQTVTSDSQTWHVPKYHVPANERMDETACGRPAAEFTAERIENIRESARCQRPGCRQGWLSS